MQRLFDATIEQAIQVAYLYEAGLGRFPDLDGLKFWIEEAFEMGLTLEEIGTYFLTEREFTDRFGSVDTYSDEELVKLLYRNILRREGEEGGVDYWTNTFLGSGESRGNLLVDFARAPENIDNAPEIEDLKEPEPGTFAFIPDPDDSTEIYAAPDRPLLRGLGGDDSIYGGPGPDRMEGHGGNDLIDGGDGIDIAIFSGEQSEYTIQLICEGHRVSGPDGDDTLVGIEEAHFIRTVIEVQPLDGLLAYPPGGPVPNLQLGDDGPDPIAGLAPDELLLGLGGQDSITGGDGDDELCGGTDQDSLRGDAGVDLMQGGADEDTFVISRDVTDLDPSDGFAPDPSTDVVRDFQHPAVNDRIGVREVFPDGFLQDIRTFVSLSVRDGDTYVVIAGREALVVENSTLSLAPDDPLATVGFDAPENNGGTTSQDPYGFATDSSTVSAMYSSASGEIFAYVSKAFAGEGTGDADPAKAASLGLPDYEYATMDVFLFNPFTRADVLVSGLASGEVLPGPDRIGDPAPDPAISYSPALSADGLTAAFASTTTLDSNGEVDVYVRDMLAGTDPVLVSAVAGRPLGGVPLGEQDNARNYSREVVQISSDGQQVSFLSQNALDGARLAAPVIYLRDLASDSIEVVSLDSDGLAVGIPLEPETEAQLTPYRAVFEMSGDATRFVFATREQAAPGDDDDLFDVFLHDTASGETLLLSTGVEGNAYNPTISRDGATVAFQNDVREDPDPFLEGGEIFAVEITADASPAEPPVPRLVSEPAVPALDGYADPEISGDGGTVLYQALTGFAAAELVVQDLRTSATTIQTLYKPDPQYTTGRQDTFVDPAYAISDDGTRQTFRTLDPRTREIPDLAEGDIAVSIDPALGNGYAFVSEGRDATIVGGDRLVYRDPGPEGTPIYFEIDLERADIGDPDVFELSPSDLPFDVDDIEGPVYVVTRDDGQALYRVVDELVFVDDTLVLG